MTMVSLADGRAPLVSIIVPSYNQGRFIRRTVMSILEQDYRPIEALIIDGASSDETVRILHEFDGSPEVTWISEPDRGVVEAVNKGLSRARGEIGAIQSSDDFYLAGAVTAAVEALRRDPELVFVYGDIVKVDSGGKVISTTNLAPFSLEGVLSFETWVPQPSTFFRMALAKELGGWREEIPYAADTDLWLRMALRSPALKVDRVMSGRTIHEAQRDKQGRRIIRDYARAIESLDELLEAPARVRRAAHAGTLLMANRYDYEQSGVARWFRLWKAALIYPRLFLRIPLASFLPGWHWLRAIVTRTVDRAP